MHPISLLYARTPSLLLFAWLCSSSGLLEAQEASREGVAPPGALRVVATPPAAAESPPTNAGLERSAMAYAYEYVPLSIEPTGGRTRSRAYGINATGQVAARSSNYDDTEDKAVDRQAFVWDGQEGAQVLPTLDGESGVWDINDGGYVSGYSYNSSDLRRAVRWDVTQDPVSLLDLGTLTNPTTSQSGDESTAYGLGPMAEVTGYSDIPNDAGDFVAFHAFVFTDSGGLEDLGTFSSSNPGFVNGYSISYDANSAGALVGLAHSSEGGWHFRPFIYDETGGMRELARAPAYATPAYEWYATAINDAGLIGGHVIVAPDQSLPHYWPDETATPVALSMPTTYPYGEIYGVNATGVMVGIMWNDAQEERAFVFDPLNGVRDLNALVDPGAGWTLEFARDINDLGQIVGSGTLGGLARGFLLTPATQALGRVSGSVRHELTGAALAGVEVSLYDDTGALTLQALTDGAGSYETDLAFPGTYFAVAANTLGGPDQLFDGFLCTGCDPTTGTAIPVEAGLTTTSIDFELGETLLPIADVVWTRETGALASGNDLTKTAPEGWNAGAVSTLGIESGDGYVEFTVPTVPQIWLAGLSRGDASVSYADIDYGVFVYLDGSVLVFEGGEYRGYFGSYTSGDRFRVGVEDGVVKYRKNGEVFYQSTVAVGPGSYPLLLDTALYSAGTTLIEATIAGTLVDVWSPPIVPAEDVVWTREAGVAASGNDLAKTATAGWNAGAVSTLGIESGDGYVEFTVPTASQIWLAGLSRGDDDVGYADIDYGVFVYVDGSLLVFEGGQYRGYFGSYASGDRFRVGVERGVVRYRRNGDVFYESTTPVTPGSYPLVLDTALYSAGASLTDATIAGTLVNAWVQ